jgi:protein O-mannosyl-transferase
MASRGKRRGSRAAAHTTGASPPPQLTPRGPAVRHWALAVGLSAVLVYLNALGNEFVLDDTRIIRDNLRIRSLGNIPGFFTSSYWDQGGTQALYRPVVLASYSVNYALHGLSTYGYTAVNIALHATVTLLLFALVLGIGGPLFAATLTGLAFAIHPVHTEAVTGMAGRPELLASAFFLLALHFHRLAPGARRGLACRAGTLACFAAALLSKESAITLVLVLPVMDALFPAKDRRGEPVLPRARIVTDYVPVLAIAVGYLALRNAVLGGLVIAERTIAPLDNPIVPLTTMPLGERLGATTAQALMTPFAVIFEYARLLVWPARLSPDYSLNQIPLVTSPGDGRLLAGVTIVAACFYAIAASWRRSPLAAFGLAFLTLTFSVVSNFVITIGTICAERLMYLPSAGALIAASAAMDRLLNPRIPRPLTGIAAARRRLAYLALAIAIAMGAARTWVRNRDWKNELTLWSAAIEVAPRSAKVQSEYGRALLERAEDAARAGRRTEAEKLYAAAQAHFERALSIFPSYAAPMDGLATIHSLHQRYEEALLLYERAVKVYPRNVASLTNWGALLWDQSTRLARRASALHAEGKAAQSDDLVRQADAGFSRAAEKIDQAIALRPSYDHAHLIRALLLQGYLDNPAEAIREFELVLRLRPDHPQRAAIENALMELRR